MNQNIRDRLSCAMRLPIALAGSLGLASLAAGQTVAAVPELLRAPVPLQSRDGVVDQRIDAVFGLANIQTPNGTAQITVRAYAPPRLPAAIPTAAIPGPTIVFNPGDLLRIRFENQLNATANPALNSFDNNIQSLGGAPGGFDDIRDHAAHEISIPNDSNVTNLHVHGLHVDPKQDDVTLLILPKDYSPGNLTPELQRFVPTINRWWTRAYQYKIPADHIPGTYWYHSHKHGSTSTQVENGMAGTLLMLPKDKKDDIVPEISGTQYDRVLMIQELQNFGAAPNVGGGSSTAIATALANAPAPGSGKGKGGGKGAGKGKANAATAAKAAKGGSVLLTNNNVPAPVNAAGSIVTVNGQYQPTLKLPANQIERWRFILAGANHTAAGALWVGKYSLPSFANLPASFVTAVQGMTTVAQAQAYTAAQNPTQFPNSAAVTVTAETMPGVVKLVSVDGIPMRAPVDITPGNPTLGGAGNRFDLFVRPDATATSGGPY
ncbi:MAG TPA: multicopper oxidase domain-containing protein, partial [Opitutaceae bacterium]